MNSRSIPRLLSTLVLVLASVMAATAAVGAAPSAPPDALEGRYIVVFSTPVDVPSTASALAQAHGLRVGFVYEHALQGMSASVPAGRLAALEKDPRVAYVVEDMVRTISAQDIPTGIQRIFADTNGNIGIDGNDDCRVDVDVAVIDTGIDLEHPDLNVNVVDSVSCLYSSDGGPPWARSYYCDTGGDDDHYHGTHVAGTIAALDNDIGVVGVAPGARLWAVKVCDAQGSCPSSAIIAGIDHVAENAGSIEVANMSLGGAGFSQAEYDAIQGAVDAGVAFAVAAGNEDDDANDYSPAAFDNVLTVSALADFDGEPGGLGSPTCRTDQDDTLADFSNWGSAVQIAAPGVCILSTYPLEQGEYGTISGTSMASPHAAGALALLASRNNPGNATDVYNLYDEVIAAGNFEWEDDSGDDEKEPLLDVSDTNLFNPVLVSTGGGDDNPPTVTVTSPQDGATVSGTITVAADASDEEGVTQVEFFADGSSIAVDSDSSDGWSATWDTTAYADGSHTVSATATDTAGQTASDSVTVTVDNGGGTTDEPPTVTVSNPADGASVSGSVTVEAEASDDEGVTEVEFFVDGNSIAVDSDGTDGWSTSWDTTAYADGSHTVSATATDTAGQTASDSVSVTVDNSGGGGAGGMYVWDIRWKETGPHLKATATIRVDSNGDGQADSSDDPVNGATVDFTLRNGSGDSQSYTGTTDSAGVVEFQWKRAPSGTYTGEVTDLTHSSYTWDPDLDADNPDEYTKN